VDPGCARVLLRHRWSDRRGTRLGPLREIGVALTVATALVAVLVDAPLAVLIPATVVCGVLGLAWNGLSFTAAAETAGRARSGAALGFQQMMLGVVVAAGPPAFAAIVAASSWRVAYACAVAGPAAGVLVLRRLAEPDAARSPLPARRRGTSASLQAARRTLD